MAIFKKTRVFLLLCLCYAISHSQRPRKLIHTHLESAPMFGNSTDLMYYYARLNVGDFDSPSV